MSEKSNGIVTSGVCVCECENGAKLGFWWFNDGNSKLNLQIVKELKSDVCEVVEWK